MTNGALGRMNGLDFKNIMIEVRKTKESSTELERNHTAQEPTIDEILALQAGRQQQLQLLTQAYRQRLS